MIKKICLITILLLATFSFAGKYDKDIVVKNQSRNDKVKTVFKEMMNAYEEEDIEQFFSYVSEDRFQQDYMTFYEAIEQDLRVYDILNIDTWVDKITGDGVKRFLYVKWDKRYESSNAKTELNQKGYSRFLFDEINGKYKLIELAGNNFWGGSLPEWTAEVPPIAGQEEEQKILQPDLVVENLVCTNEDGTEIEFEIVNMGDETKLEEIGYKITDNANGDMELKGIADSLGIVRLTDITAINCDEDYDITASVDYENTIVESDETNNETQKTGFNQVDRPDLIITDLVCSNENGINIEFEIQNNGAGEITGDINYKIVDNQNGGTEVTGITTSVGVVNVEDTGAINCDEDYDITASVDYENTIVESDETNNETQKTGFNQIDRPDLIITNVYCSANSSLGFEIENDDVGEVSDLIEYMIVDNTGTFVVITGNSAPLGRVVIDVSDSIDCSGSYDITVRADRDNKIKESDETNNEAQGVGDNTVEVIPVTPAGKPDLIIVSASCFYNSPYQALRVTIENQGTVDVSGTFKIENLSTGVSHFYTSGLASGDTDTIDITADTGCNIGHTIKVDSDYEIDESEEYNNETITSSGS